MSTTGTRPITAEIVVDVAWRIVDEHGADALTMRRLADELGVAVTSIYWHVGNRDELIDQVVTRLVADMGTLRARGDDPRERIASLARALRRKLLDRPHLIALAHERARTQLLFEPVEAQMAQELAALDLAGTDAQRVLRALELHVVSSVLLERTVARLGADRPDDALEVFEFTLQALVAAVPAT